MGTTQHIMVCCACCPKIFSFHLGCLFGCAFFGIIGIVIAFKASDYVKMLVADDAYSMGDGSTFAGLSHACLFFGISTLFAFLKDVKKEAETVRVAILGALWTMVVLMLPCVLAFISYVDKYGLLGFMLLLPITVFHLCETDPTKL
eukprot:c7301_g1_i1.p2 GENE.c7301_g1_i1~~c7301_g1_i1.p2  ORF type:complete len:146 (+),score=34.44 c7301_g1_i1:3-440(+)